ncbi:hypothetical protein BBEV_3054 [Salisediminibacterium beveridgei]|uniref:Uncharacterized protein n=1 Tax=Salisediminibacterium beveridgei TaxID=632773 RepID=A0A1D7QZB8_9BACI|nr:hypothetical protein BBEV_3054 [Salisediminibacterium beveridgei]
MLIQRFMSITFFFGLVDLTFSIEGSRAESAVRKVGVVSVPGLIFVRTFVDFMKKIQMMRNI